MALIPIPPWVQISPMDFINSASTGARIGLERAGLETQANDAAQKLQLGYAQLAAQSANEGSRANAAAAAQALDQSKFLTQANFERQNQDIQQKKLADQESKAQGAQDRQNNIDTHAANFLNKLTSGSSAVDALEQFPLASRDPAVKSLIVQSEIAKRTADTQKAITDRSGNRLQQLNARSRINDLARSIRSREISLSNPNLDLDDVTKKHMQDELKDLKSEKAQLEKELQMPGTPGEGTTPNTAPPPTTAPAYENADPLGILAPATAPTGNE